MFSIAFVPCRSAQGASSSRTITPPPYYSEPTPPPTQLGSWYYVSGYILQPQPSYVVSVKDSVTIKTKVGKNTLSSWVPPFLGQKPNNGAFYKWYALFPGESTFKEIDNDPNSPELTFKSSNNQPQTIYFQAAAQVVPRWLANNPPLYSNVTKVEFVKDNPEPLLFLDIWTSSNYLIADNNFKDNLYFAEAIPKPSNPTDVKEITWSIPNVSDRQLFTIDKSTGEMRVNVSSMKNKQTQDVTIRATAIRKDGTVLAYKEKTLTIGNFVTIENKQNNYKNGDSVTFVIHGSHNDKMEYYLKKPNQNTQVRINSQDIVVVNKDTIEYTVNHISSDYNGDNYIMIKQPKVDKVKAKTIQSNPINLSIDEINNKPRFQFTHTIEDKSYPPSNINDSTIQDAICGDTISHSITIEDLPKDRTSSANNGTLYYPISPNETISTTEPVLLNDNKANNLTVHVLDDNVIKISNIPTSNKETIKFFTKITNSDFDESEFTYTPYYNIDNKPVQGHFDATNISFSDNKLSMFPRAINFGIIQKIPGRWNLRDIGQDSDAIIDFIDTRRFKNSISIDLNYSYPFFTDDKASIPVGNKIQLGYFDAKNHEIINPDKIQRILTSQENTIPEPVTWASNEGLRLLINNPSLPNGAYKTTLEWTIVDSRNNKK